MRDVLRLLLLSLTLLSGSLFAQTLYSSVYTSTNEVGRILYTGPSTIESLGRCQIWINIDPTRSCTNTQVGVTAQGVPFRKSWRMFVASGTGVWTWIAPTALENGNILTDLSHYVMYKVPPTGPEVAWAQIDGRVKRAIMPMGPEDWGACFYFRSVRKPATSPAVPSDKSNSICMDAKGQQLPLT